MKKPLIYRTSGLCTFVLASCWGVSVSSSAESASLPSSSEPAAAERPAIAGRRIVKHFDFNEQPLGNFDNYPLFWRRNRAAGFPLFLEGTFDKAAGHAAPPSLRLDLDGGSLAYHYEGRDISVRTSSDYLVVAWVRTHSLKTARAYISAYYLDRKGMRIPGTEQRSTMIGNPQSAIGSSTTLRNSQSTDWQPVTVSLPGNVPASRHIGISLWLTQAGIWDAAPAHPRSIDREDVKASAWFDDITVYRLPRVTLSTSHASNLFRDNQPVELKVEVSDPDGLNLLAKLRLYSADGRPIDARTLDTDSGSSNDHTARFVYDSLPAGLYRAELIVQTGDTDLIRRSLRFVRAGGAVNTPGASGRGFGIVLTDTSPAAEKGQRELLQFAHVEYVKLPVWSPREAADPTASHEHLDRYLEGIVAAGCDPIGIMVADDRTETRSQEDAPAEGNPESKPAIDLLTEDPAAWKPLIAGTWARYAGLIHFWQLGTDRDSSTAGGSGLPGVIPALRREMTSVMSEPRLATVVPSHAAPDRTSPSDYQSVLIPKQVPPGDIAEYLKPFTSRETASAGSSEPQRVWAIVEPLPEAQYSRELRLADLGWRLVEAYFQKVACVFLRAPWDLSGVSADQLDPHEDLIIFKTVADLIGGTVPISRTIIDGRVHCMVFDRRGQATLFVWDPQAPPDGRRHVLYLGAEAAAIDLWGRRIRIETVGNQQAVRIGPMPLFIINTPTWLVEFRRQFVMQTPTVEASFDVHERHIVFRNTYPQPISGMLRLVAPEDWEIRPSKIPFALQPGEEFRQAVTVRFPLNAESGVNPLVGEFDIDADRHYHILAPAWFELGLENLDLETYVYRAGSRAIVRQSMTNRTPLPVNFDGYLVTPHRQRITRSFVNIEPGQSVSKDFVLENAADLSGSKVRIALKEIQGARIWNRVITVP